MKLNFKVGVLDQNFSFFGLKRNDIKQRSGFWPKIQSSQMALPVRLTPPWKIKTNSNKTQKSQKCRPFS